MLLDSKSILYREVRCKPEVREFAAETVREIDVFNASDDSYGYVFYVLQARANTA